MYKRQSQGLIAEASETRWWVFLFYVSQAGYVGLAVRFATAEVNDVASQNYASRSITTALKKLASPTPRPSLLRKMSSRLLAPSSPATPPKLRSEGLGVEETKVAEPTGSSPSWRALGGVAARVKRDASRTVAAAGAAGARAVVAAGAAGVAAGTLAASGAKSAVEAVGIDVDRVIGGVSDVTGTLAASGANQDLELVRTFKGPMLRSFCMSPYFRDGGAAVLDEWVALEAIMKPYVADTSITNNYSNSHEARFYRNILDAVPVLLEVMVDAGEDAPAMPSLRDAKAAAKGLPVPGKKAKRAKMARSPSSRKMLGLDSAKGGERNARHGGRIPIVTEILDPRTQQTIQQNDEMRAESDFLQSNDMVSKILAMVCEDRSVKNLLDELLTPRGSSMACVPASRYCRPGERLSFFEMACRCQEYGEILIGYLEEDKAAGGEACLLYTSPSPRD